MRSRGGGIAGNPVLIGAATPTPSPNPSDALLDYLFGGDG